MGKKRLSQGHAEISRRGLLKAGVAGAAAFAMPVKAKARGGANPDSVYRIHPAIGIARLGNADPSTFFIGPEIPGLGATGEAPGSAIPPFKVGGLIKPQAARFRLFEYRMVGGLLTPVGEVNLDTPNVIGIRWNVHLANKKASFHKFYGPHGETEPSLSLRNPSVSDRSSLDIDFLDRSISGVSQGPTPFSVGTSANPSLETYPKKSGGAPVIDYLGQLRTDGSGRLLVIGGKGKANYSADTQPPMPTYANNDGWFDDVSDGPVTAVLSIRLPDSSIIDIPVNGANGAWVLCPPPDFAPPVKNTVTMYDLLYDVALRSMAMPANALYYGGGPLERLRLLQADYQPGAPVEFPNTTADFDTEIRPMLLTGYRYWWVDAKVTHKHDSLLDPVLGDPSPAYQGDRSGVFVYMRAPGGAYDKIGKGTMPHILGDDPYLGQEPDYVRRLTLTRTQYGLMRRWTTGNFAAAGTGPVPDLNVSPHGLDRAALEACVGGAFFPGIEASWQIRNPNLYAEPFRLNLNATSQYLDQNGLPEGTPIAPGHFTRQMAVPWQADFNDCRNEGDYGWWPGQRPNDAYVASAGQRLDWARPTVKFNSGSQTSEHLDMAENWYKFGFVVQTADGFVESERAAQIP